MFEMADFSDFLKRENNLKSDEKNGNFKIKMQ